MEFTIYEQLTNWDDEVESKLINLGYKIITPCYWILPDGWTTKCCDTCHYDDKQKLRVRVDKVNFFITFMDDDLFLSNMVIINELKQENKKLTEHIIKINEDLANIYTRLNELS